MAFNVGGYTGFSDANQFKNYLENTDKAKIQSDMGIEGVNTADLTKAYNQAYGQNLTTMQGVDWLTDRPDLHSPSASTNSATSTILNNTASTGNNIPATTGNNNPTGGNTGILNTTQPVTGSSLIDVDFDGNKYTATANGSNWKFYDGKGADTGYSLDDKGNVIYNGQVVGSANLLDAKGQTGTITINGITGSFAPPSAGGTDPGNVTLPSGILNGAGTFNAPTAYANDPNTKVSTNLQDLLAEGSPYLESAKAKAMAYANSRGLLNSTMAGKAGIAAAIEAALPIAQGDAGYTQNLGLNEQKYGYDLGTIGAQADASSVLSAQEAAQNMALDQQQQDAQKYRLLVETDLKKQLENQGLVSDEIKAIGSSVTLLGQSLTDQIMQIQINSGLSPESKSEIIQQMQDQYKSNVNSVAEIYGVPITWV